MLATGGELLYVTCSVFKDENQNQIHDFLSRNNDAAEIKIEANWGKPCEHGRQLLPGEQDADGFYFCRLKKMQWIMKSKKLKRKLRYMKTERLLASA